MDARHVIRRLEELRDWADYIHDSLTRDQPYEEGKLALLAALADAEELRVCRAASCYLAKRLRGLLDGNRPGGAEAGRPRRSAL